MKYRINIPIDINEAQNLYYENNNGLLGIAIYEEMYGIRHAFRLLNANDKSPIRSKLIEYLIGKKWQGG